MISLGLTRGLHSLVGWQHSKVLRTASCTVPARAMSDNRRKRRRAAEGDGQDSGSLPTAKMQHLDTASSGRRAAEGDGQDSGSLPTTKVQHPDTASSLGEDALVRNTSPASADVGAEGSAGKMPLQTQDQLKTSGTTSAELKAVKPTDSDTESTARSRPTPTKCVDATVTDSSSGDSDKDGSLRERLGRKFYDVSGEELAQALLGQKIVRMVDGVRLCAKIVETEAYLGAVDKAAHSYKRQTDRNKAMFMQPGTAYVYNIYGMYCCLNISSQGEGCAVLIRSVEALEGVDKMLKLRRDTRKASSSSSLKVRDLGNGPSKLCQSLAITKATLNQRDLVTDGETWLEKGQMVDCSSRVVSKRINIAYAEDWTDKPLRFYVLGNSCVSVRDKEGEKELASTSPYFS